jgi:hypothetical protein
MVPGGPPPGPSDPAEIGDGLTEPEPSPDRGCNAPVELAGLGIVATRPPWAWQSWRPRARARWGRWLASPERRQQVGYFVGILCNLVLLLLLASWLTADQREPEARTFGFAAVETLADEGPIIEPPSVGSPAVEPPGDAPPKPPELPRGEPAAPRPAEGAGPASSPAASPAPGVATVQPSSAAVAGSPSPPEKPPAADAPMQGKLDRRSSDGRGEGVRYGNGTPESEAAVERGLRWLVAHQRDDGSWHFNHTTDACMHYCTHPGTEASTTASTAMALLPLLGAGYTHRKGDYQDVVQRGLDYLRKRGVTISYGFDMRDGSIYGHALATIALGEAYAMTRDPVLEEPAQGGIRFIAYAQDAKGGGWRYNPGEPGDTTVTGWMLAALKSGQMAGLEVPTPAILLAERFLDSVQSEEGSAYGYMTTKPQRTNSAVGLLCRMYTGWKRDHAGLAKGVANLAQWGPAKDNIYYDYYATQVMFHYGGPQWDAWNRKMRELLIASQDRGGHQAGSWYFEPDQADSVNRITTAAGGRLLATSMAIMILEVYYRYMPLYSEHAVEGGF